MLSKRTIASLLKQYDQYTTMRQDVAGVKAVIMDPTASFEEKMDASSASSRLNEFRIAFFPRVRAGIFAMPDELIQDLKARYLALDEKRSNVQSYIRDVVYQDHDKALDATSRIADNIQSEREIVEDAIQRIKNYKPENKKNGT